MQHGRRHDESEPFRALVAVRRRRRVVCANAQVHDLLVYGGKAFEVGFAEVLRRLAGGGDAGTDGLKVRTEGGRRTEGVGRTGGQAGGREGTD